MMFRAFRFFMDTADAISVVWTIEVIIVEKRRATLFILSKRWKVISDLTLVESLMARFRHPRILKM